MGTYCQRKECKEDPYINTQRKLEQLNQKLQFLSTCKDYGLIPDHLKNSTKKLLFSKQFQDSYDKIERKFLQQVLDIEISDTDYKIGKLGKALTADDYVALSSKQNERDTFSDTYQKQQQKYTQEIEQLKETFRKTFNITFNAKWFVNTTGIDFPHDIQWLLSFGKDFALPVDEESFPLVQLIMDGEAVISTIEDKDDQDAARAKYSNILKSFYHSNIATPSSFAKYVLRVHKETIAFLKTNNNILITEADKGHVTVAMDRTEYDKKREQLLSDHVPCRPERVIPTRLQTKNNEFVESLTKQNILKDLTTHTAHVPSVCGLPMIHTTNMPLSLISLSTLSSPCYDLSMYVKRELQSAIMDSTHSIKNSFEFVQKARNIELREHDALVCFAVVSPLTNIPLELATAIVMKQWDIISQKTRISRNEFKEILKFCLRANRYMQFKEGIYRQLQGFSMIDPLSPTIADLVLDYLLDSSLKKIKPRFSAKYSDNIFVILKHDDIDNMLRSLNQFDPIIQFTAKREQIKAIEFLDVKIQREQTHLSFNWHQTDSESGRLVNYMSNQPKDIIINTASALVRKIFALSDRKFRTENEQKITKILTDNSFPKEVISSIIEKEKQKSETSPGKEPEQKGVVYKSMLYISELAESFEREIVTMTKDVHITYKSYRTLASHFTDFNVKVEKSNSTNVVYKINCLGTNEETCGLCYIGETECLSQRMKSHQSGIKMGKKKKTKSGKKMTTLEIHAIETEHQPDFDNVEILQTEDDKTKRRIFETLHILNHRNSMNKRRNKKEISKIYVSLVSTIASQRSVSNW